MPGLGWLQFSVLWLISLITTIAEPLLIVVIIVMVAGDVTGGELYKQLPFLTDVYAWGQGIGIEGQLVAMIVLSRKMWHHSKILGATLTTALCLALLGVTCMAVGLANMQQTFGLSVNDALASLGISQQAWVWVRAVVLCVLAATGAILLWIPEKQLSTAEVEAQEKQLELKARLKAKQNAIKQQERTAALLGWKQTFTDVTGLNQEAEAAPEEATPEETAPENVVQMKRGRGKKSRKRAAPVRLKKSEAEVKAAIRAVLLELPSASQTLIAQRAQVSVSSVSKHYAAIASELGIERAS